MVAAYQNMLGNILSYFPECYSKNPYKRNHAYPLTGKKGKIKPFSPWESFWVVLNKVPGYCSILGKCFNAFGLKIKHVLKHYTNAKMPFYIKPVLILQVEMVYFKCFTFV